MARRVWGPAGCGGRAPSLPGAPHEGDEVAHAARIAPFVVVPGQHLDERAVDQRGRQPVHDRGMCVAVEVHRHERLVRVTEYALARPGGGGSARLVAGPDRTT